MKYMLLTLALLFAGGAALAAEDSVDTLYDLDKKFSQYSAEYGPKAAFAAFISEDVVELEEQGHPVIGRGAVLEKMPNFSKDYSLTWAPHGGDISASLDLGYTWGVYTSAQSNDDGSVNASYGKYITIWKKSSEGKWQVVLDGGNSSPGMWPEVK